jgi:hypothetical protein
MGLLGDLPPEVVDLIVGSLADGHCEGTLAAFAASCRGFYKMAMPYLYYKVADRHPALMHWAARVGRAATAKRLIEAGAPVQSAMRCDYSQLAQGACKDRAAAPREIYRRMKGRVTYT